MKVPTVGTIVGDGVEEDAVDDVDECDRVGEIDVGWCDVEDTGGDDVDECGGLGFKLPEEVTDCVEAAGKDTLLTPDVDVKGCDDDDEAPTPAHSLFPQFCPGLQALHSVPTVHWIDGKSQHTASEA